MRRQSIRAIRQQEEQAMQQEHVPSPSEASSITAEQDNGITVKPQNSIVAKPQLDQDEERATEKLTLYLHPSQRDKLDELIMAYKKQTGRRITHNKLMRKLIDQAELANLL